MQKTIIDLPHLKKRIDLLPSQWKALEQWMNEENVAFRRLSPEEASLPTDDQTTIVYQITDDSEKVLGFLEKSE
ncbi:MAG: hypothetical protein LAT55_02235 [Opitutales bacterium]|nr:hypothetical protein [Opitutales bacterium]